MTRPFRPPVPEDLRPAWAALAASYRFLYDMTLQERLDIPRIRRDVNAWWRLGGERDPTPTHFG